MNAIAIPPRPRPASRRLIAVKLIAKDRMSQAEVARVLNVSREAVRKWWQAYEKGGKKALASSTVKRGPKPELSEAECRALVNEVAKRDGEVTIAGVLRQAGTQLRSSVSRSALRRRLVEFGLWP
jgi:transposase